MRRDNHLTITGHRVLRFPAFVVRDDPGAVADQIRTALRCTAITLHAEG
jgi:very-short-patch-repair endonuclease